MSLLHISSYKGNNEMYVNVGWELAGIRSVKLLRYSINGIPQLNTNLCYYLRIQDLDTQSIWAGIEYTNLPLTPLPNTNLRYIDPINQGTTITSCWPLYLTPNSTWTLHENSEPVEMCGSGNGWSANKRIKFEILDSNLNPAIFNSIAMDFYISKIKLNNYPEYQRYNTEKMAPFNQAYMAMME